MKFPRASGILLHPTSLPGKFGIGDLGPNAFKFVDFLRDAGQTYWQILPLGPTGYGDSPYSCYSAFAGNTLLISPDLLVNYDLLDKSALDPTQDFPSGKVDYQKAREWKGDILQQAFARFSENAGQEIRESFSRFEQENSWWLNDYALYRAAKAYQQEKPWYEWSEPLRFRAPSAITEIRQRLFQEIEAEKFCQFLFYRQWAELKQYANKNNVRIIGDIPIFVALDSSDVWCNQDKFKLNPNGSPQVVSGVPPDYFSKTGQLWGNPIYDWEAMRRDGFGWWGSRFTFTLRTVDIARIDHFRGFVASWEVPGEDETAENGKWVDVPGRELFTTLKQHLGDLPLIVEDLGDITPDVINFRDSLGFPGMKVLQFALGGDARNYDLPHNYINNCVAYTGTHDNDTTVGWYESKSKEASREKEFCLKYLDSDGSEIHWDFIRAVWASVADTAIAPMQDVLGLGNEARMNLPASDSGNWSWRLEDEAITNEVVTKLKELTEIYGRD